MDLEDAVARSVCARCEKQRLEGGTVLFTCIGSLCVTAVLRLRSYAKKKLFREKRGASSARAAGTADGWGA